MERAEDLGGTGGGTGFGETGGRGEGEAGEDRLLGVVEALWNERPTRCIARPAGTNEGTQGREPGVQECGDWEGLTDLGLEGGGWEDVAGSRWLLPLRRMGH